MIGTLGIITIVVCFFLGAPIFCVFGAAALLGWYIDETSISVVGTDIFRLSGNFVLVTIPMFTYAGYLLGESRAPQRLVKLSRAFFGLIPGGLAIVAIVACSLFD
jgi:TRAP-type mannitol/chloroaromatic compound transport system permease large subunit